MKKLSDLIFLLVVFTFVSCVSTKDTSVEMSEVMVYEGYLMDVYCGESGKGMDGSDPVNAPWDHTTKCLIMCEAGGYGLSVKDGEVYNFIPFADQDSHELAVAFIADLEQEDDVKVTLEGYLVDGQISVKSIVLNN